MNRRARATSGLAVAALFAAVASLHAYVLLGPDWPTGIASYRINANFPAGAPGTDDQVIEAIRGAADAWRNQAQADIQLNYLGTTAIAGVSSGDGVNAIFHNPANPGGGTLAVTYTFSIGSNFTACDMAFFGQNDFGPIVWNGVGDPTPSQTDLAAVATHEFGHFIGLDHTPITTATMYEAYTDGSTGPRTLATDDINGARFIYGFDPGIDPDPQIDAVDPPTGPPAGGNTVSITGQNFTWETDTTLRIDGVALSQNFYSVDSTSRIVITSMPAHAAGPVSITIENQLGSVTLASAYLYGGLPPTLFSVIPAAGPVAGGNIVSLIGENFASDALVVFGSGFATGVTLVSAQELRVTAPPGPGPNSSVSVLVSQLSGSAGLPNSYLYTDTSVRLELVDGPVGGTAVSRALATTGVPLAGFSLAAEFDGSHLDVVGVTAAGTAAAGAEFYQVGLENGSGLGGSWWVVGCVMSFAQTSTIPPGVEIPIAATTYEIESSAPPGTLVVLDLANGAGVPPTDNIFVPTSGIAIDPATIDGILTTVVGQFLRGDGNGDGTVNVADAVFTLSYLFSQGAGPCPDALDANDDGSVDIGDAIYELGFLFSGGPPPPPPFPNAGADPTSDPLGC